MDGILPPEILRKRKHGFGVPVGYWAMHDTEMKSLAAILDEPETRQRGYFQPEFLTRIQQLNKAYPAYYGDVLWALITLELWHRRHYKATAADAVEVEPAHAS
jgi:asparagine synthase (glutamine-hydrolysing)